MIELVELLRVAYEAGASDVHLTVGIPPTMRKSRDTTQPTKVGLVKAMVFPVVMYGCESWTIKKAEH